MSVLRWLWFAAHLVLVVTAAMTALICTQLLPFGEYTGGISLLTTVLVLLAGIDTTPDPMKGRRP